MTDLYYIIVISIPICIQNTFSKRHENKYTFKNIIKYFFTTYKQVKVSVRKLNFNNQHIMWPALAKQGTSRKADVSNFTRTVLYDQYALPYAFNHATLRISTSSNKGIRCAFMSDSFYNSVTYWKLIIDLY